MKAAGTIICLLGLLFPACEEKVKPSVTPLEQTDTPDQESWNSTVTFSDSAKTRAVLWSGHIAMYTQRQYTLLSESVRVDFYNDLEQHTSTLTARRGKVNDVTRDFEAFGSVRVTSDSGTVLTTDSLFWSNQERRIYTDAFVDILSPTEHIMGHGLVSDQGLKNYRIARVTGQAVSQE